jgi:hypothetical protein
MNKRKIVHIQQPFGTTAVTARCDGTSSSITCQVALPAGTHSVTVNTWNTTGAVITQHESFIVH